ncbi:hypothetical protein [Paenibacillus sp. MMS20-IR301]|uniref:hypothetical protein n=1 Tax=Paenibacillus sp. MMS20-IR301 TaxID=2895946 RepID=UPI0028E8B3F8|nr:hypothetical protein [Paenibacillus sp. MMS20-IR301]WNS41647.1 hypothetical protein LOS79_21830 [Paenibacillus sp. MMS20-IR301]
MEWSRSALRGIPNAYNEEAKRIDEQILGLVLQRRAVSGGKRLFPDPEVLERWSEELGMETAEISLVLSSLNETVPRRHFWEEPGELCGVLPLMKTTRDGEFEYTLTHSMQYEHLSIVSVEVKCLKQTAEPVSLQAELTLAILGQEEYEARMHGGRGGGSQLQMQFMVSPPLPDLPDSVEFSLIPAPRSFLRPHREEIILDKQIDFN